MLEDSFKHSLYNWRLMWKWLKDLWVINQSIRSKKFSIFMWCFHVITVQNREAVCHYVNHYYRLWIHPIFLQESDAIFWQEKDITTSMSLCLCVWAAGSAVRAAADPPAEKLPSLHGSSRVIGQLRRSPAPLQGSVFSGLRLLPHGGTRAVCQASIYYRFVEKL